MSGELGNKKYEIEEQISRAAEVAEGLPDATLLDLLDALATAGYALISITEYASLSDNIVSEAYVSVLNEGEIE
jgi:hypothetical protein